MPIESVHGYWTLYQSGSDNLEVDLTIEAKNSRGEELSDAQKTAYSHSFDSGIDFAVGKGSFKAKTSYNSETTKNLISTVRQTVGLSQTLKRKVSCPGNGNQGQNYARLWQWKIDVNTPLGSSSYADGLAVMSQYYVCTFNDQDMPKCEPHACVDAACQACK